MNTDLFESRKREHITHSLDLAHQAKGLSGLESIHLVHEALPEHDFAEISIESVCLGQLSQTPFFIAGMTAGHTDAPKMNRELALACVERGWAMGVGSQRRDLLPGQESSDRWKILRAEVPGLTLFANIGITQLIGADFSEVLRLTREIKASALVIHINALQEALQTEGTPQFRGAFATVSKYASELEIPVVLKETGCGFSKRTLKKVAGLGLAAIDLSGLGGTHWGRIEGARAAESSLQRLASQTFSTWGESTVDSVLNAKESLVKTEIWASGGVRSGLDAAKLIALGAHQVGYAKPALHALLAGPKHLRQWMELQEYELKVALFCSGYLNCQELRGKEESWKRNVI